MTDTIQTDAPAPITKPENQGISEIPLQPIFTQSTQDIWRSSGIIPLIDQDQQRLNKDWLTKGVIDFNAAPNPYIVFAQAEVKDNPPKNGMSGGNDRVLETNPDYLRLKSTPEYRRILEDIRNPNLVENPSEVFSRLMREHRVLAFGEDHVNQETREFINQRINELKQNGFTHLAIEAHGKGLRDAISKFNSGEITIEQLREIFGKSDERSDPYFKMLQSAKDAGLQIVGIDAEPSETPDDKHIARDERMASEIQKLLLNPNNKLVVLVGANHLTVTGRTGDQLRKAGVDLKTIFLSEPDRFNKNPLIATAGDVEQPTAIEVKKSQALSRFPSSNPEQPQTFERFDYLFLFPGRR